MTTQGHNETSQAEQFDRPADGGGNHSVRAVVGGAIGGRVGADVVASVPRIPPSIVKAICQIKATVEAVKKSAFNEHGRYKFSSTDDIYAALSRKMGEVGIICLAMEEKCEIKRVEKPAKEKGSFLKDKDGNIVTETVQWANIEYSFVWATEEATWTDPKAKRSIYIQVTGPQTFQAAQSFIEKAYLRSTFKIPSGDMDLDSMPQADNEDDQVNLNSPRKAKSSSRSKKDGDDVPFNELRGAISGADGPAELVHIRKQNWTFWSQLPGRWREIVDSEYDDKMQEFGVSDGISDEAAE